MIFNKEKAIEDYLNIVSDNVDKVDKNNDGLSYAVQLITLRDFADFANWLAEDIECLKCKGIELWHLCDLYKGKGTIPTCMRYIE